MRVNGALKELSCPIHQDSEVKVITRDDAESLDILRHDCAHVLAQAVQELYPDTQITFGPVTDDGFYYDFYRPTPFSTDDFPTIEKRMAEIVDRDLPIQREEWDRARQLHISRKLAKNSKPNGLGNLVRMRPHPSIVRENWPDLCRGPHPPSTGKVGKALS